MLYRKFKFNWFARPLRPVGNATWRCGICAERQCLSFSKVSLSLRSCSFGSFISCFQGPNGDVNQLLCRADPAGRYPGLPLERALPMDGMGGMMQKGFKLASSKKWAWGLQVGVTTCIYIPLHSITFHQTGASYFGMWRLEIKSLPGHCEVLPSLLGRCFWRLCTCTRCWEPAFQEAKQAMPMKFLEPWIQWI